MNNGSQDLLASLQKSDNNTLLFTVREEFLYFWSHVCVPKLPGLPRPTAREDRIMLVLLADALHHLICYPEVSLAISEAVMYSSHSLCCVQVHFTSLWLPLMPNVARNSFLVMETVWLAIPCLMRFRGTGKDYILFVVWTVPMHSFLFIWRFKGGPVIFGLLCASNRNVWVNLYILISVMQVEQNEGNTKRWQL